jgi:hypothetical protein
VEYGKEYDLLDKVIEFKIEKFLGLGWIIYLESK